MNESVEVLRIATLLLLVGWRIYWHITEVHTENEQPVRKETLSLWHKKRISMHLTLLAFGVVGVQLLGVRFFDMPQTSSVLQISGFFLALIGIIVACMGRYALGTNWARCYDYQVKQHQQLVTHGIYKYIRHPVYSGILLFFIGSELVVQSWLIIVYIFLILLANRQAVWEETLLIEHFGDRYRNYMKHTKRFIPYIW